tara:strand:+ start:472 stop:855 length:384 start_codon:yes stop_codon:yes gene_type:complete
MKILGLGIDLIKNQRVNSLLKNKAFIRRTFSKKEINNFKKNNKKNYFAKRFAAKESFSKSFGTGIRDGLNFKDIEVLNDKLGKPYFFKNRKINSFIRKRFNTKKYNLFLSISDEKDYSIAITMIQKS